MPHTAVIASGAKQSRRARGLLARDCFVASLLGMAAMGIHVEQSANLCLGSAVAERVPGSDQPVAAKCGEGIARDDLYMPAARRDAARI